MPGAPTSRIVNNFSGGELSDLMYGRTDFAKYHTGLKIMQNMLPLPQGGAVRRPGTVFVADSTYGPDLAINGLFTTDIDWTKGTGWSIAGGKATCSGAQSGNSDLYQTPGGLVAGVTYQVVFTLSNRTAGTIWAVIGGTAGTARSSDGVYTEAVTCGSTNALLALRGDADFAGDIDGVILEAANSSVRLVPFEFSTVQAYILEFGAGYIRVMAEQGVVSEPDNFTEALFHFDETNGATLAEDSSGNGHTASLWNGARISHDSPVFGPGRLELSASPACQFAYLADDPAWDWGTSEFNMEGWWRPAEIPGASATWWSPSAAIFGRYIDANNYWALYLLNNTGTIYLVWEVKTGGNSFALSGQVDNPAVPPFIEADKLYHLAIIRGWGGNANDWAVTVNGQAFLTGTNAIAMPSGAAVICIGRVVFTGSGGVKYAKAGFDEFRLSIGTPRQTVAFQPPTQQYPQAGGGIPYHVPTAFRCDELREIQFAQSADYLFLVHPNHAPQQLTRTGHTAWILQDIAFSPPPTFEADFSPASILTPGAATGTGVSFTATTASTFLAGDVDRQIVSGLARAIITGVTSDTIVVADIVAAFPSTSAIASGDWSLRNSPTGSIAPSKAKRHSIATITAGSDVFRAGDVGKYIRIAGGVIRITGYASATSVTGEILSPLSAVTSTSDWTLEDAAWSSASGYPAAVTFHEERLLFAGSAAWPQTIWGSVTNDWTNFNLGAADADSVAFTLASGEVNPIQWLLSQSVLFCGTTDGEWAMGSSTVQEPLTPSNVWVRQQTKCGAARMQPIKLGHSLLYLQRLKKTLLEQVYQADADMYESVDLSILASHLTRGYTMDEMAFQREPFSTLWIVRSDGELLGFSYYKAHEIAAWHRHDTGAAGKFKSVAVIPGLDREEVWFAIQRTVDGLNKIYIEFMASGDWTALEDAWYLDSAIVFSNEASGAVALAGLDHLEDETVNVWADGLDQTPLQVVNGAVTADNFAQAAVGLPFDSQLETLNLEVLDPTQGTTQGRKKKLTRLMLRMYQTGAGVEVGPDSTHSDAVNLTAGVLFTGDKDIFFPGGWDNDLNVIIQQSTSAPMTVLAMVCDLELS